MRIYNYDGDGWWPALSPDGQFVAFGGGGIPGVAPPTVRVVHLPSGKEISLGFGRRPQWISPTVVTWLREKGRLEDTRMQAEMLVTAEAFQPINLSPTPDDPSLVCANEWAASSGHWASWRAEGLRLVYDGRIIMNGTARGCEMKGDWLLTTENERWFVRIWRGTTSTRIPQPERSNEFTISDHGFIGYGYFWPARVITPTNEDIDVTATPWQKEGVPYVVHLKDGTPWVWTYTERPSDGRSLMLGRPLGAKDCVIIDGFAAVALDVVWTGFNFIIAGCDAVGRLQVHQVGLHTGRRLVTDDGVVVDPEDPEDPEDPVAYQPQVPNKIDIVRNLAARYPIEFNEAHHPELGDARAYAFIKRLAWELHQTDARFGLNGKRGGSVLSWDAIAYKNTTVPAHLGACEVVDVIGGAGGDNPQPAWQNVTDPSTGIPARWVQPEPVEDGSVDPGDPDEPEEPGSNGGDGTLTDLGPVISEFDQTQALLSQLVMAVTMQADATNRLGDQIGRLVSATERIETHDLVTTNMVEQVRDAIVDARKRMDMAFRIRLT